MCHFGNRVQIRCQHYSGGAPQLSSTNIPHISFIICLTNQQKILYAAAKQFTTGNLFLCIYDRSHIDNGTVHVGFVIG